MPSNKDLGKSIRALDPNQELEDKSNQELEAILATLQAADADAKTKADADAKTKADAKKPAHYVAPGKAITTKRGMISGDDELEKTEIRAEDLPTGEDALKHFVKTGHVLKGG